MTDEKAIVKPTHAPSLYFPHICFKHNRNRRGVSRSKKPIRKESLCKALSYATSSRSSFLTTRGPKAPVWSAMIAVSRLLSHHDPKASFVQSRKPIQTFLTQTAEYFALDSAARPETPELQHPDLGTGIILNTMASGLATTCTYAQ